MDIVLLDKEKYRNHYLDFSYVSDFYYDVTVNGVVGEYSPILSKKKFDTPYINPDLHTDYLYAPHWEGAEAYGILINGVLIAVMELWLEEWSSRLRITELWIAPEYRRQKIGTRLINFAIEKAKEKKARLIILETQTSNAVAVGFYLKMGFNLIGFDTTCYGENDVKSGQVRLEMGLKF